ncbi:MAG: type II toxin-antitoxin system PemK/MazF family toxin [Deltaproteobacteria bacterium]|nr:type II toxin-antitoxin system PemK/MazF family toxin [Deltaproteobacteria bacterium]
MRRGTVCWINLEPSTPPEFGKVRPGVIISNSEQNLRLSTVVVLPFSSLPPEIWPLRVECTLFKNKPSFAVIPGLRQVDKRRLQQAIGFLPPHIMRRIDEALEMYLKD